MVSGDWDKDTCRTPPRVRKHLRRLGVPSREGLLRVEAKERDIPPLQRLEDQLGPFSIDLFASRTNAHLPEYCGWRPDPAALAVDALSIKWQGHVPAIWPHPLLPRETETRKGISSSYRPTLAQSGVVPTAPPGVESIT